ncbi:CPBP family intramembrane metalloprotease [Candidatus Dependentiae bacterium]|jgi:membrane protease YdiL (CAAX protease family)|nr:CPBP family intramembrane metalloprotease [Candidatus Dependentiae bacterium]
MLMRTKVFLRLWGACILGSVAVIPYIFSLTDLKGLPAPMSLMAMIKILQDAAFYGVVTWAGVWLCEQVGFRIPFFSEELELKHVSCLIWRSIVCGVCVGMSILSLDLLLPHMGGPRINETTYIELFRGFMASFYGAINEEVLLRLFFLSLFVWILIRIFGQKKRDSWISVSIIISSLLFGIMHLPTAAKLAPLTVSIVARVLFLNGISGIMFGILFTQCGLEAAMIAHFAADILLHVLPAAAMMVFL